MKILKLNGRDREKILLQEIASGSGQIRFSTFKCPLDSSVVLQFNLMRKGFRTAAIVWPEKKTRDRFQRVTNPQMFL